jgi:hypothetical protein
VIVARFNGIDAGRPRFVRSVVSEHEDRAAAAAAAREVISTIDRSMSDRPTEGRDQVFVRKPDYKSLKTASRVTKRRK